MDKRAKEYLTQYINGAEMVNGEIAARLAGYPSKEVKKLGIVIHNDRSVSLVLHSVSGGTFGGLPLESYLMIKNPELFSPQEIIDLLGTFVKEDRRTLKFFKELLLERCPYDEVQLFLRLI